MSTTVADLRSKSVFELSDAEFQKRLRPAYEAMKQNAFANGSYITYHDPAVCPGDHFMVHEYSDRKKLVLLDQDGQAQVVKTL